MKAKPTIKGDKFYSTLDRTTINTVSSFTDGEGVYNTLDECDTSKPIMITHEEGGSVDYKMCFYVRGE